MSDDDAKYISEQQQRLLKLVSALAGHEVEGLAPGDIARRQGCHASQVTRDLRNLARLGYAETIAATGRWRLGPALVQIALAHMTGLDRARRRLEETQARFSRRLDDARGPGAAQ